MNPPSDLPRLSVSVITFNEEHNLPRCLESVRDLAAEIVVVDASSTDGTRGVAERFSARVITHPWQGFRDQKAVALSHCREPWVLALDADEELSAPLRESIRDFLQGDGAREFAGAFFPRKTWFLDRWITHGDWYPDYSLRLFRRDKAHWGGSAEHDKIVLDGPSKRLSGDLLHRSFPTLNRYVEKINVFADFFLQQQVDAGRRWSLAANLLRPLWRFVRAYVLRAGFLDGFPGFWIAAATAFSTFVRYSRLYEWEAGKGGRRMKDEG